LNTKSRSKTNGIHNQIITPKINAPFVHKRNNPCSLMNAFQPPAGLTPKQKALLPEAKALFVCFLSN